MSNEKSIFKISGCIIITTKENKETIKYYERVKRNLCNDQFEILKINQNCSCYFYFVSLFGFHHNVPGIWTNRKANILLLRVNLWK